MSSLKEHGDALKQVLVASHPPNCQHTAVADRVKKYFQEEEEKMADDFEAFAKRLDARIAETTGIPVEKRRELEAQAVVMEKALRDIQATLRGDVTSHARVKRVRVEIDTLDDKEQLHKAAFELEARPGFPLFFSISARRPHTSEEQKDGSVRFSSTGELFYDLHLEQRKV